MLSGLVGLAVTYYYDSEGNAKMHTILKYGMKLLGLALVATSTSLPAASATLAACLVALDVSVHMVGPRCAQPALWMPLPTVSTQDSSHKMTSLGVPLHLVLRVLPLHDHADKRRHALHKVTRIYTAAYICNRPNEQCLEQSMT